MKTPTIGAVRLSMNYGKPSIYKSPSKSKKKRQDKAKKTLAKLIAKSPDAQKLISQRAYAITKKKQKSIPKPVGLGNAPIYSKGMGSEFYITKEWRQLRYSVLVKYGKICMCCGSKQGYLHVDHIKPRSKFPELELEFSNLQVLCEACNVGKSNQDQTDWRR